MRSSTPWTAQLTGGADLWHTDGVQTGSLLRPSRAGLASRLACARLLGSSRVGRRTVRCGIREAQIPNEGCLVGGVKSLTNTVAFSSYLIKVSNLRLNRLNRFVS
jgi:hypothetical protein